MDGNPNPAAGITVGEGLPGAGVSLGAQLGSQLGYPPSEGTRHGTAGIPFIRGYAAPLGYPSPGGARHRWGTLHPGVRGSHLAEAWANNGEKYVTRSTRGIAIVTRHVST